MKNKIEKTRLGGKKNGMMFFELCMLRGWQLSLVCFMLKLHMEKIVVAYLNH